MIYAINFTCDRDWDLRNLMLSTYEKHTGYTSWISENTDKTMCGYGNGAGWGASMLKLGLIKRALKLYDVKDTDFILSVDSDVVFTSPEVFKYADPAYGLIGIKHRPEFKTFFGDWSHMSGALIFIRGDIARKMADLNEATLNGIRMSHFKGYDLTENEDVVLSYLASYCGANYFDLGTVPGLSSGDFESDVTKTHCWDVSKELWGNHMKSFYHLNYCPTQFLGEPVEGKWDIPKVLKMKEIEL